MADKKRMKQRKVDSEEKPTKEEYAVAKYLRFGLPAREGKLHGMEVQCFFGNAAVDKLLDSKWSASNNANEPLFTNRVSCVAYMLRLLEKGLFHRAERDKRKKDDKERIKKKKKDKEEKDENTAGEEELRERKGKKEKKGKMEAGTAAEESADKKDATEKKEEKKKKEKRLRLVMPDQQFFEDSEEIYVWIYDPVKATNFLIGLLMVLGAIGLCMFPLWPPEVRIGVYYLSLSAAGFVGFILSLVVVRLILFCCIWTLTMGRHHFWFLPNLTEDVGFFDSFKPLYKYEYVPKESSTKAIQEGEKKKKKPKKADKDEEMKKDKSSDKDDSDEFEVIKKEELEANEGEDVKDDENDEDGNEDADNNDDDVNESEEDNNSDDAVTKEKKKTK